MLSKSPTFIGKGDAMGVVFSPSVDVDVSSDSSSTSSMLCRIAPLIDTKVSDISCICWKLEIMNLLTQNSHLRNNYSFVALEILINLDCNFVI